MKYDQNSSLLLPAHVADEIFQFLWPAFVAGAHGRHIAGTADGIFHHLWQTFFQPGLPVAAEAARCTGHGSSMTGLAIEFVQFAGVVIIGVGGRQYSDQQQCGEYFFHYYCSVIRQNGTIVQLWRQAGKAASANWPYWCYFRGRMLLWRAAVRALGWLAAGNATVAAVDKNAATDAAVETGRYAAAAPAAQPGRAGFAAETPGFPDRGDQLTRHSHARAPALRPGQTGAAAPPGGGRYPETHRALAPECRPAWPVPAPRCWGWSGCRQSTDRLRQSPA